MSADILDTIDSALDDYATSADAMRWHPDAARLICDGGKPLNIEPRRPRLGSIDYSPSRDWMEDGARFAEGFAAGIQRAGCSAAQFRAQLARIYADAGVSLADLPAIGAGILGIAGAEPPQPSGRVEVWPEAVTPAFAAIQEGHTVAMHGRDWRVAQRTDNPDGGIVLDLAPAAVMPETR